MTDDEDKANGARNAEMQACYHRAVESYRGNVYCQGCGARFALVLLPRNRTPLPYPIDEDEE